MHGNDRAAGRLCHMCGIPNWAISTPGVQFMLHRKSDGRFKRRDSRVTVWCCSESCAWQSLAVAEMGPGSHKWPTSLGEFISANQELFDCSTTGRPLQNPLVTCYKQEAQKNEIGESDVRVSPTSFVTPNGRPRRFVTNADRQRAYRQRSKRASQLTFITQNEVKA